MTGQQEAAGEFESLLGDARMRDLVEHVRALHAVRAQLSANRRADTNLTEQYRKFFAAEWPHGAREVWDGEHNIGVGFEDGNGSRGVDFERLTDGQIVKAARAGLLSLNAGAFDGALKSGDQRLVDAARGLATQVYNRGGGYDPATGRGGAIVLLPKRGEA